MTSQPPTRTGTPTAGPARSPAQSLRGVVTPLVTPLLPDGGIDSDSVDRLVDHQLAAGVHGLLVLGTSGEGAHLTTHRRAEMIETTLTRVAGRVPVIAGVIDTGTQRSVEHIEAASAAGVAGVVATAPFYGPAHPNELGRHFRVLARAAAPLPLYAYDIPSRTGGGRLPTAVLLQLAAEGVVAGVKDSTGQDAGIRALLLGRVHEGVPGLTVLTGSELTADVALSLGCDGVVPGLGNVDPAGYVRIFEATLAGDHATARREQERLFHLAGLLSVADQGRISVSAASLGAFKTAAWLLGVLDHATVVEPGLPLLEEEVAAIRALLVRAGLEPVR